MKINVALLAGGNSSEREIATKSAAMVMGAFDRDKYNVMLIDVFGRDWVYTDDTDNRWYLDRNDFSVTVGSIRTTFDYAFIMIHGTPGEDGKLQGYLDMMNIPYSSSGLVSTVVTFDKELCKRTVSGIKELSLAKAIMIRKGENIDPEAIIRELGLPVFVKPNASGSSYGVTKVKRTEDIFAAVETAFSEGDSVMIEQFIQGREIACGVFIAGGKEYVFPVTEIISRNEFFDYEAKYTAGFSDEITPADIPDEIARKIQRVALRAYKTCGCQGLARIDFIVGADGKAYMIEINSIPGMSPGSIVPKQITAAGMTMTEVIDIIIDDTICSR